MADLIIRLEELEITMFLGIHDFERARMQRVLVSAEITVTGTDWQAGRFFDYDRVAEFIRSFNGSRIDTPTPDRWWARPDRGCRVCPTPSSSVAGLGLH
mgnify:CR=1 FL=1